MSIKYVNKGFKNQLFSVFPHLEIIVRIIYWKNINYVEIIRKAFKSSISNKKSSTNKTEIDFLKIIKFLKDFGICEGDSLLVHSSYDSLKQSRKLPKEIIDDLLDLVGQNGNLIMPANRVFKVDCDPIEFNVNRTRVWSGALPFAMLLRKDAEKSRFPINSVVVIGKDAKEIVSNNICEDYTTPCGLNSSWHQCYLKNAYILGIGIDLTHSLTMTHVVEDSWEDEWPISDWYDEVKYKITDNDFQKVVTIRQRKEKWGKFYFAERKLAKDLYRASILKAFRVEGVDIQLIKSQELVEFLRKRNKNGYPFYCVSRFKRK